MVGHNGISNAIGIEETAGAVVLTFFSTILSVDVLEELAAPCTRLAEDDRPDPLVLRSAHPHVFLAGAHLGEIAELDKTRACLMPVSVERRFNGSSDSPRPQSPPSTVPARAEGSISFSHATRWSPERTRGFTILGSGGV
ncbi:MAG: hypothetical protein P8127_06795 [Acidobacteriota bacterium]